MTTESQPGDVIDLLLTQHSEIKDLFGRVAQAHGADKREQFENLVRLLAVHETAEEELIHPLARTHLDNGDTVVEALLQEEHQAKRALSDLYDLGVDHPDFDTRLGALRQVVVEHAEREEHEEFGYLQKALPADRLQRLTRAVLAAEKVAPTRPHAGTESTTANLLLGPPLAVFDRVRDALRNVGEKGRDQTG
jgi:hypothetical protein